MTDYQYAKSCGIITDIGERWEKGLEHHPLSDRVARFIKEGDTFGLFEFGGDGDNGEDLLFFLDAFFELFDYEQSNKQKEIT